MGVKAAALARKLLIVSPRFPPVSAADAQRTRSLLPVLPDLGWEPHVLACTVEDAEVAREPEVPASILPPERIRRVRPLPAAVTRWFGVRGLGWRARRSIDAAFRRWHAERRFDAVLFSNTEFALWPLAGRWRRETGVPVVLDWQDPWVSDYYAAHPGRHRPGGRLKYDAVQWLARRAEPAVVEAASAHIAVSGAYLHRLARRYPSLDAPVACVPFAFDPGALAAARALATPWRPPGWGARSWVYVGRGGEDMQRAAGLFGAALALGAAQAPGVLDGVTLHLVGTDYAPAGRARETLRAVVSAVAPGVAVHESPGRVGLLDALRLMDDAELTLAFGSDDPAYNPSKIAACLAASAPVCGVFHAASDVHARCAGLPGVAIAAFGPGSEPDAIRALATAIPHLLAAPRQSRRVPEFEPRGTARRVVEILDAAVERG